MNTDTIIGTTIANTKITIITLEMILFVLLLCILNMIISPRSTERILYMNFPFFASFIILILLVAYEIKKHNRGYEKENKVFWDREMQANNIRKKSLDHLEYINIPFSALPFTTMSDDDTVSEYQRLIKSFEHKKAVNLTGFTNTDLKFQYGAPNITILTKYDQNYTILVRTLYQWGETLYKNNFIDESQVVLEFAISTKSDISGTYKLLAEIYINKRTPEKIQKLIVTANELNSIMKSSILSYLKEFDSVL